jgi:hypothetical protein
MILSSRIKNILLIGSVSLALLFAYSWHKSEVKTELNALRASLELQHRVVLDEQRKRLLERSRASERVLQEQITLSERDKNAKIKELNSTVSSLRSSLLKRPEGRISQGDFSKCPSEGTTEKGATGLQLSRMDADVLARFSRDTSELQIELKSCLADYESVRKALEKFKEENLD